MGIIYNSDDLDSEYKIEPLSKEFLLSYKQVKAPPLNPEDEGLLKILGKPVLKFSLLEKKYGTS